MARGLQPEADMPTIMDSLRSKGRGIAEELAARSKGLVGVFARLSKEHGEVSALLDRVRAEPTKRADLWSKIRLELLGHEHGELETLYAELRTHPNGRDLADLHDAEAAQLDALIRSVDGAAVDSETWLATFEQLAIAVATHAEEEETELFPQAQDLIGKDRAKSLDDAFVAAKQRAQKTATNPAG
jgi:NhaP-type Na+/H+ and K+/H+ antiporter